MKPDHIVDDISDISRLFYRHFNGQLSDSEEEALQAWIKASKRHAEFSRLLTDPDELQREYTLRNLIDSEAAELEMQARLSATERPQRRFPATAAIIALLVIPALWLYLSLPADKDQYPDNTTIALTDDASNIKPGTTKAILTTPAGESIALGEKDSTLVTLATRHSPIQDQPGNETVSDEKLCLEVPRGGEFKVLLEDSTVVWLNSESSLRYPETFAISQRRVELIGEAYFEVKSDTDRPFIVETGEQIIKVYGTTFNVRNYADDDNIYTTLESGLVTLARADMPTAEAYLSPGLQAVFNRCDSSMTMRAINTRVIAGWRNGRFVFEGQRLRNIMYDLARWYNFDFTFADDSVADVVFNGSIPRYADFKTAIRILENCGGIAFRVQGTTVTISAI